MENVLIIDNYDSFTYNLAHYVAANSGYTVDVYRNDEISIADVGHYNTIILSPGPGLPKDAGILNQVVQQYAPTKKILGVCLGMQAIAEVFGGTLTNLNTVFHGVATPIRVLDSSDLLFKNLPSTFDVGRYHSWVVDKEKIPQSLQITAIDANNQMMALKHRQYQLYGVQFHPESILTANGKEIINNFLGG